MGAGIGSALGGIAVLAGAAGDGGKRQYKKNMQMWEDLVRYLPEYNQTKTDAPEMFSTGQAVGESYDPYIQGPNQVAQDSPEVRQKILQALGRLQGVSEQGLPLQDRIQAQEAQGALSQQSSRNQEAILRNLQERGRLGGGDEIAARMIGNQQSADMARGMGADLAQQSIANRLDATYGTAQMGQGLRGQDFGISSDRTGAMNRFNEWASQLGTQARAQAAGSNERAQNYNLQNTQRLADTNVGAQYNNQLGNINRENQLKSQAYDDRYRQTSGASGGILKYAGYKDAEQKARENAIMGIGEGVGSAVGGAFGGFGG